jgi:inner membrane protein
MQTVEIPPSPLPPPSTTWSDRLNSPLSRLILIGVLLLVLQWPLGMIEGVVHEREARRDEAVADIMAKWGRRQDVTGPMLRVPYWQNVALEDKGASPRSERRKFYAYFLPETLQARAKLKSEQRSRGIFEVPVYQAELRLQGRYRKPDFREWDIAAADIDWAHAELVLGISDPRAIHADASLSWNGRALGFKPSSGANPEWTTSGVHVALGEQLPQLFAGDTAEFLIDINFNGSERLFFAPMAERSTVSMQADWPHPSFQGNWLPSSRSVSDAGFQAEWSVSYLGRDYPQQWRGSPAAYCDAITKSLFGADLMTPVDHYTVATRISKYAVLTVVFTFLMLWLVEVLSGRRVHAIQYGFIGVALCLFGLLQLSFAEHFGFAVAFLVATLAVTAMVTLYALSVLQSLLRALAVGLTLGGLYAYLYMILCAEDYALLGGSLALFFALALAMYLTRRIDWFQVNGGGKQKLPR